MKRLLSLGTLILLTVVFCWPAAAAASSSGRESLVAGNNIFALNLYRELGEKKGNLFFSPYSVSTALAMTYAGARGNTEKEMAGTLQFYLPRQALGAAFKNLAGELADAARKTGQKLGIANALVLTGGDVSSDYKRILKNDYDAEIFRGGLAAINGWVRQKTEGKIEKILEQLDANSVCVLLDAIYFKGNWASQFSKKHTREAPFHISADQKGTVLLMYQKSTFKLLDEKDFQAIALPYRGEALSMVILLPREVEGLPGLERQLSGETLTGWLAKLDACPQRTIKLYLPKFKLETGCDLVSPLTKMGMKDAFSLAKADFRGMGWAKGDLYISQIKHKAVVEVNEEGTEAAAATAVEMATKSVHFDPEFRADHPFFFLIRDNRSGVILFLGRMTNPAGK